MNGRTIAEDMEREYQRQSLRDHFAAAALTGFIRGLPSDSIFHLGLLAKQSYEVADAILRERDKTNHDAAPAARADLPDERPPNAVSANGGTPCAASRDGSGTGNTQEPVAWAVVYPNDEVAVIAFKRQDAVELATASDRVVPLYRSPSHTLTSKERVAVAWAATFVDENYAMGAGATLRNLLERLA